MSISSLPHHHIFSCMLHILLMLFQFKLVIPPILLFNLIGHPHIYIYSYDIMLYYGDNMLLRVSHQIIHLLTLQNAFIHRKRFRK